MGKMFRILGKRGRITIPFEIRQRVGFAYNDILSFVETKDGQSVIVKREKICDNCKSGVSKTRKEDSGKVTLFDFLNGLSQEQQRAALIHLSVEMAKQEKGDADERP